MHTNAHLIEALYAAIRDGKPDATAGCYAADARFRDIAFNLNGRESILQMWRMVCSRGVKVTFDSVAADEQQGRGHWVASYTFSDTGRRVVNDIQSRFVFREGLIIDHRDDCNALAWAKQAYGFPKGLFVGLIGPLRRCGAQKKLKEFIGKKP
jgi:hypothetical protein